MNYSPLSKEEFEELERRISNIKSFLPDGEMSYVWQMFNKIRNANETQPCSCRSSAGHWKRAVDGLNNFVKERLSEQGK